MADPALSLAAVGKRYTKVQERSLVSALLRRRNRTDSTLWALRDVSFDVEQGESVAVVGGNGAGKSTLLRLLAAVSQPTEGEVTIRGRVAPLLSVGVGFHQEMTGRENVLVNGMLLGLTKRQIAGRLDAIVDFAELHDFIDVPVKFYSSGMFMRLGFSVAVHVDPGVMLVDEVLAVGDAGFQLRCLNRLRELAQEGTTIVFVSHSMHAVQLLCSRSIVLDHGRVHFDGATERAVARYHQLTSTAAAERGGSVDFGARRLLTEHGAEPEVVVQGQSLIYQTVVRFGQPVDGPGIRFRLLAADGSLAYSMQSPIGDRWRHYDAGEESAVRIPFAARLGGGGTFHINLDVLNADGELLSTDVGGPSFFVPQLLGVAGPAELGATITVDGVRRSDHTWSTLDAVVAARPHHPGDGQGAS
ncbi:MAG: polysaccharide ABC transporter ATP-binding protein [Actinomycetota bacterium]|nr:polysaccharide ABC transporter ATP-binding protein [Actinomycetota bacterium]